MPTIKKNLSRKQQILETLALELENHPGEKITTAALARAVGVSEAALYRHFSSKAKMFEALIEFSENAVFGLINQVLSNNQHALNQIESIIAVILMFSSKNPGITCVLTGNALVGEHQRLRTRTDQFFKRIEAQLKQILRHGKVSGQLTYQGNVSVLGDLMTCYVEGQMSKYTRTHFSSDPVANWEKQWQFFHLALTSQPGI